MEQVIRRRAVHQVMPPLEPDEYQALKESIKEHGLVYAIQVDSEGNILDGHHRYQAWQELRQEGYDPGPLKTEVREDLDTGQAQRDFAREINSQRRSLSFSQRQALAEAQLRETPERADQWLADMLGIGVHMINGARLRLEAAGAIPMLEKVQRRDGRWTPRKRVTAKELYPELIPFSARDARRIARALDEMPKGERKETRRLIAAFDASTLSRLLGRAISREEYSVREVANGHGGYLWYKALSDLYGHIASVNRQDGFLPLVRRWDQETKEGYLQEIARVQSILSSWQEILEQEATN